MAGIAGGRFPVWSVLRQREESICRLVRHQRCRLWLHQAASGRHAEITKVIRPKRDVVNKENPPKLDDVLDPIPQKHKLKRNKKSKYDELAKRLEEREPEEPTGAA